MVAGVRLGLEVTTPLTTELVEQTIKVIPTPQQSPTSEVPTVDKGKAVYILAPKKKPTPPTNLKGIVIGAPVLLRRLYLKRMSPF